MSEPSGFIRFPRLRPRFATSAIAGLIAWTFLSPLSAAPPPPELSCGLEQVDGLYQCSDGVVDIQWTTDAEAVGFELQEANDLQPGVFKTRYRGADRSSVRTGLAGGIHEYRVRAIDSDGVTGPWSETLTVQVSYMPRERLRLLLVLGGFVVAATITAILHGHYTHRKEGAT